MAGLASKTVFGTIEDYDLSNVGTAVTGEAISVPATGEYIAALTNDRVPKQESPSTVLVSTLKNGAGVVYGEIVSGELAAQQMRVRYGMSRIEFSPANKGDSLFVNYKYIGTHIKESRLRSIQDVLESTQDDLLGGNSGEIRYSKGGEGGGWWGDPPSGGGGGQHTLGSHTDVSGEVSVAPADGDLFTYDTSISGWRRLATGTSGEVLHRTSDGYVWGAIAAGVGQHTFGSHTDVSGEVSVAAADNDIYYYDTAINGVRRLPAGTSGEVLHAGTRNPFYAADQLGAGNQHTWGSHTDVSGEVSVAAADGDLYTYDAATARVRRLPTGASGEVLYRGSSSYFWSVPAAGEVSGETGRVKISADDAAIDYAETKILGETDEIEVSVENPGGAEVLRIKLPVDIKLTQSGEVVSLYVGTTRIIQFDKTLGGIRVAKIVEGKNAFRTS